MAYLKYIKLLILLGGYRSGQTGQTVNLLAYAFVGSIPTPPTILHHKLKFRVLNDNIFYLSRDSSMVEQRFCKP